MLLSLENDLLVDTAIDVVNLHAHELITPIWIHVLCSEINRKRDPRCKMTVTNLHFSQHGVLEKITLSDVEDASFEIVGPGFATMK